MYIEPTCPDVESSGFTCGDVAEWVRRLIGTPVGDLSRAGLVDELAALERLSSVVAARQARLAVAFDAAERQAQAEAGVPVRRRGRGVAEQIGLARRQSPSRAAAFLARAQTLCVDLPVTMTRFVAGELSEYRAGLIAAEVALLDAAGRGEVDAVLNPGVVLGSSPVAAALARAEAADASGVAGAGGGVDVGAMSDRAVRAAAAAAAYRVDPDLPRRRGRHAESERYVSLRPAPDTMTYLTAYLPVRQGVSCLASLRAAAEAARAGGDPRTQGQVMADALVARVTGAEHPGELPVELRVVITDEALLADLIDPTGTEPSDAATEPRGAATESPGAGTESGGAAASSPTPATEARDIPIESPSATESRPATGSSAAAAECRHVASESHDAAASSPPAAGEGRDAATEPREAATVRPDVPGAAPHPTAEAPAASSELGGARVGSPAPDDLARDADVLAADVASSDADAIGRDAPGGAAGVGARNEAGRSGVAFRDPGAEPAVVVGYGPIPAASVRAWLRESLDANGRVWIRRLLTDPISGQATAIDARARLFPPALRRLILARDQFCRTPFCGAPIRHIDHAHGHAAGGATSLANGQGLCQRCNQAKTAPGWAARPVPDPGGLDRHVIETTTPSGHRYISTAPPVLPTSRPRRPTTPAAASESAPARAG